MKAARNDKSGNDYSPRRIASLQPSATVILAELGAHDRLVACTKYCAEVCPGLETGRRVVADSWTAKAEEILAAKPDLVIASVPYQVEALTQILKSGVRFLGLAPRTLADIYADIATIAGVVGMPEAGGRVIKRMQDGIESIRKEIPETKPRSRPQIFSEEWGKPLIASQPWVAELVETAGGEFVGIPGRQTTAEEVLRADPDIIIAAWCGAGDRVPLEKIVKDRGWETMSAVRKRQVYCVPDPYFNTPAPTLLTGLKALAKIINPELSAEVPGVIRIPD